MKGMNLLLGSCYLWAAAAAAGSFPSGIKDLVPTLKSWGQDPLIIAAVQQQNQSGLTLDAIKQRDQKWRTTEGVDAFMEAMMSSPAAKRLLEFEKSQPFYFEIFLMDNQGANVAMTNKTSDYWQGDETKWQASYNNGEGAVHFSEVEFDESAQDYLLQISVPVTDQEKVVGAMTIGINLDVFEGK